MLMISYTVTDGVKEKKTHTHRHTNFTRILFGQTRLTSNIFMNNSPRNLSFRIYRPQESVRCYGIVQGG